MRSSFANKEAVALDNAVNTAATVHINAFSGEQLPPLSERYKLYDRSGREAFYSRRPRKFDMGPELVDL